MQGLFELIQQDPVSAWLIFGAICVVLEGMAIPGIGFLFAGLAAITVGGLLTYDVIARDNFELQVVTFLATTFVWAVLLWIPLKKFRQGKTTDTYSNIVGDSAVVTGGKLKRGKLGSVKWSGTLMQARLDAACSEDSIAEGTELQVVAVDGNILTVAPRDT